MAVTLLGADVIANPKSWIRWAGWTFLLGFVLFFADRTIDFNRLGIVRCGPGTYVLPFGSHPTASCNDKGLLDDIVNNNVWLTLVFWIGIAGVVIAGAMLMRRKSSARN
jgi:hypothetical protein